MIHTALNEFGKEHEDYTFAPMSVCSAMSQGYIGYDLQNGIRTELLDRGIFRTVSTVLTQVMVFRKGRSKRPVSQCYYYSFFHNLYPFTVCHLSDKIRPDSLFFLWKPVFFLAKGNALHQDGEGHCRFGGVELSGGNHPQQCAAGGHDPYGFK